jgi:hypothetical protein
MSHFETGCFHILELIEHEWECIASQTGNAFPLMFYVACRK